MKPTGQRTSGDEELARKCAARDAAAWEELYARYSPVAKRSVGKVTFHRLTAEDAEDVVADVFSELAEQIGNYRSEAGSLSAYISGIAKHKAIDRIRKSAPTQVPLEEAEQSVLDGPPPDFLVTAVWRAARRLVAEAQSGPAARRSKLEVVIYASMAGDTATQIAQAHGWSVVSVHRIRVKFLKEVRLELEAVLPQ